MLIQMTGLSGAGKTTLANAVQELWQHADVPVIIVDGDAYRKTVNSDLGFSKQDRCENIRRLGRIANEKAGSKGVAIIAAINPYDSIRQELRSSYQALTVWVHCPMEELFNRDTKGLYTRALLPEGAAGKVHNLSGVNDPYEEPSSADLIIHTGTEPVSASAKKLLHFIQSRLEA